VCDGDLVAGFQLPVSGWKNKHCIAQRLSEWHGGTLDSPPPASSAANPTTNWLSQHIAARKEKGVGDEVPSLR